MPVVTDVTFARIAALLAADSVSFSSSPDGLHVRLFKSPITPTGSMDTATFASHFADFDGGNALAAEDGDANVAVDGGNGNNSVELVPPLGGFRWSVSGSDNLPQTIYGYVVMNTGETVVLFADLLPAPITLTGVGQVIELGFPKITINRAGAVNA